VWKVAFAFMLLGIGVALTFLWYVGRNLTSKKSEKLVVPAVKVTPFPHVPLIKSNSGIYLNLGVGFMYIPAGEVLTTMMAGKLQGLRTMFIKNGKMIDHVDSGLNLPVWLEDLNEVYGLDLTREVAEVHAMREVVVDGRHLWLPCIEEGVDDAELQRRPGLEDGGFWFNC